LTRRDWNTCIRGRGRGNCKTVEEAGEDGPSRNFTGGGGKKGIKRLEA